MRWGMCIGIISKTEKHSQTHTHSLQSVWSWSRDSIDMAQDVAVCGVLVLVAVLAKAAA